MALTSSLTTYIDDLALDDEFTDLGASRALTPADVINATYASDAVLSPDGAWLVYVRKVRGSVSLWLVETKAPHAQRRLTAGSGDSCPTWSADSSTVAFLRNGQVFVIDVRGGEAIQLTRFAVDVGHLRWAPTGDALLFAANVHLGDHAFDETAAKCKAANAKKFRTYDELPVLAWDHPVPPTRSHLFVVPLSRNADNSWQLAAPPRDLMRGVDADCPTNATFSGREEFAWSPDGTRVAFVSKARTADAAWSVSTALHLAHIGNGNGEVDDDDGAFLATHSLGRAGVDTHPVFSPDGLTLAWIQTDGAQNEAAQRHIAVYTLGSKSVRRVELGIDVSVSEFAFASEGKIVFTADHEANHKLFELDLFVRSRFAATRILLSSGSIRGISVGKNGVFGVFSSFVAPPEIVRVALDEKEEAVEQITQNNAELLAAVELPRPRSFTTVGARGQQLQLWMCVPPRAAMLRRQAKKAKLPLLLMIHGGPQGAWDNSWHARWNLVLWASLGGVCVAPNFTGSTGFGQANTDAISKHWDDAVRDCLLAADFVLEQFDFVDSSRQIAMGASFGGWATLYLAGIEPTRFCALAAHDGVFDQRTMAFQTDELFFTEQEFGIPNNADADECMRRCSPSTLSHRWQTPLLLIHGAKDYRCPLGESLGAFAAARRRGVRARLAICDEANHWVTNPEASAEWHALIEDWLCEHCEHLVSFEESRKSKAKDDETEAEN